MPLKPIKTILFLLAFANTLCAQEQASRIPNSPFPVTSIPTTLYAVNDHQYSQSELFTVNSLMGILAKSEPSIYRNRSGGHAKWLQDLSRNYGTSVNWSYASNFEGLITHFKDEISGYVLCNLHTNSSNAAISICGILNAIAVTPDKVSLMNQLGIELLEDVRQKDEQWAYNTYKAQFNKKIITYQKEEKDAFLGDYSIYANAFHFFDPINSSLTNEAFTDMDDNSMLFGWGDDEFQTVAKASTNSINVFPADWAVNISTLSNFEAETKQGNSIESVAVEDDVHTVCFVMSDGDNIQWMLNDFSTNTSWYASPDRGKVDLGWTIPPALCELAPTVMKYFYDDAANTETGRDYFIAGPSGVSYNFPERFPAADEMSAMLNDYMVKSDLNIVNVIDSPGNIEGVKPLLDQEAIDAVFLYTYANHYTGLNGSIEWYNGKPVIGGRHALWEGKNTAESLAYRLNNMPRNPALASGYSLIPVHVWSRSVKDVVDCAALLHDKVRVVAPDEFVRLIKANIEDPSSFVNIAPEASISVSSESPNGNYAKENAVDEIVAQHDNGEWASNGETNPWIQLNWSEERSIRKIILYDRPNSNDYISVGTLTFSDGSSINTTVLPNNGNELVINFPEKNVTWVKFKVTIGGGSQIGLSEIKVIEANSDLSANEISKSEISIYPNPTTDGLLYATLPANENFQLSIYTMNGALVKRMDGYKPNQKIDISDLPRGIYILKLSNAKGAHVARIMY